MKYTRFLLSCGYYTTIVVNCQVNNTRNAIGETPLMYAVRSGRVRVIKQLLKAGADVNSRDSEGKTALDYAEGREKAAAILRAAGGKRGEEF